MLMMGLWLFYGRNHYSPPLRDMTNGRWHRGGLGWLEAPPQCRKNPPSLTRSSRSQSEIHFLGFTLPNSQQAPHLPEISSPSPLQQGRAGQLVEPWAKTLTVHEQQYWEQTTVFATRG
jgi:hypothetical protein